MLSIERVKELIGRKDLKDQDAELIRDELRTLAEIIYEKWRRERNVLSRSTEQGENCTNSPSAQ